MTPAPTVTYDANRNRGQTGRTPFLNKQVLQERVNVPSVHAFGPPLSVPGFVFLSPGNRLVATFLILEATPS